MMRLLQRPAWAAAAVLLAGLIGSPRLFAISDRWDVLSLGRGNGEDSFAVAMISDLHADIPDLREMIELINAKKDEMNVKLVMVTGDLTQSALNSEFDLVRAELELLQVPYVPLMGNHDMWPYVKPVWKAPKIEPSDPESLMTSRFFDAQFRTAYENLESISESGDSVVRNYVQYTEHPWNFETRPPHCYDLYENFGFDAGPPGSKWHFLCLDFNSRDYHWLDPWGVAPEGDIHRLPFDNVAKSIRIEAIDPGQPVDVRLFTLPSYNGLELDFTSEGDHDLYDPFDTTVSSIFLGSNVAGVSLYAAPGCTGDVRLDLTQSDPDLYSNGSAQWWRDHLRAHCDTISEHEDNVLIFAHHPLTWTFPTDVGGNGGSPEPCFYPATFSHEEYDYIAGFLRDYDTDVGGWFGGHVHRDDRAAWNFLISFKGRIYYGLVRICDWWLVPPGKTSGWVRFLNLRYDRNMTTRAMVAWDESGVDVDPFDPVADTVAPVRMKVLVFGNLRVEVIDSRGRTVRTLVADSTFAPGEHVIPWDCCDDSGRALLPGMYSISYTATDGNLPMGTSSFRVKGTCGLGPCADVIEEWMSPVALLGDVSVPTGETLRIEPGVRIMPTGDFRIDVHGTLIAAGGPGDSSRILFTPYRRLAPVPDSASPGDWKGIFVDDGGVCSLDYCAIEYAGGTPGVDSAAVYCKNQVGFSMTNSVIRHSSTRGFGAYYVNDLVCTISGDTFENCAAYPCAAVAESVHSITHSCVFRNNTTRALDVKAGSDHRVCVNAEWPKCESPGWRYDVGVGTGLDLYVLGSGDTIRNS